MSNGQTANTTPSKKSKNNKRFNGKTANTTPSKKSNNNKRSNGQTVSQLSSSSSGSSSSSKKNPSSPDSPPRTFKEYLRSTPGYVGEEPINQLALNAWIVDKNVVIENYDPNLLKSMLVRLKTLNKTDKWLRERGLVKITGNRYELFLDDATGRRNTIFMSKHVTHEERENVMIIVRNSYARAIAAVRSEGKEDGEDWEGSFGHKFSIIFTLGGDTPTPTPTPKQMLHIDLRKAETQAAVAMLVAEESKGTPATHIYRGTISSAEASKFLKLGKFDDENPLRYNCSFHHWKNLLANREKLEGGMVSALEGGMVSALSPGVDDEEDEEKEEKEEELMDIGDMILTKGGIVHQGPRSVGNRAVLFFVMSPATMKREIRYNGFDQFNTCAAISEIMKDVWQDEDIALEKRQKTMKVLKERLVEVGMEWYDDPNGLYSNEKKNLTPWDMMDEEDQLGGELNDKAWGDEQPEEGRAVWLEAMIKKRWVRRDEKI